VILEKNTADGGTFALPRKDFYSFFIIEMCSLLWDFLWIFCKEKQRSSNGRQRSVLRLNEHKKTGARSLRARSAAKPTSTKQKTYKQCCGSVFLCLLDPDPDPLVRSMDPDLDASIMKQK
jgi:hypothetical protein